MTQLRTHLLDHGVHSNVCVCPSDLADATPIATNNGTEHDEQLWR
jgi:hypothetical protein